MKEEYSTRFLYIIRCLLCKRILKKKLDNIIMIVKKDCNRMFLAFYYSPFN